MDHEIVVHVWADGTCPWCWIGLHRLRKGIEQSGKKVAVEYHSYQLDAEAPSSAAPNYVHTLASSKGISDEDMLAALKKITEAAHQEGLEPDWENIKWVNTFLAHQFVYAAKARGTTPEEAARFGVQAFDRLFEAHFAEGKDLGSTSVLLELAEELGYDPEDIEAELESGEHADAVRQDMNDARSLKIPGVPFYVVGGKFGLSGAQPASVFAEVINRAVQEMREEAGLPIT